LHAIADDLELKLPERRTVALRELQEHLITLYGAGRRVVILIDEAHVMPEDTLEQVRLLSNLESNRHKLLQIVLFGQPELDATLAKPQLRQLRDRITHSFRTRPLSGAETANYISFRMRAAGHSPGGSASEACADRGRGCADSARGERAGERGRRRGARALRAGGAGVAAGPPRTGPGTPVDRLPFLRAEAARRAPHRHCRAA